MAVLIGLAVILMVGGGLFYNKLRSAYYGTIGVGGAYMATIGIMVLVMLIATLFGGTPIATSTVEIIVTILFMLIGLGYLVYVMIVRCSTVMQRVFLPVVVVMIAFGFCWRLLFALIFKVPISNGAPQKTVSFPASVVDDQGETWELVSDSGDNADYRCRKTGARANFRITGDYVNFPSGWRYN